MNYSTTTAGPDHPFLRGGGEMAGLIAAYDWSATGLGPIEGWPQTLRAAVSMMLRSRFPMLIFWGPALITFYNDAFRPSLGDNGKHPGSLGQRGEVSWAESWPVIGPMIHAIMGGGDAVWFEDQKLPLYRDGAMGYAYWTYSFSPLDDGNGTIEGLLVTCAETTRAIESLEMATDANQQLEAALEENRALQESEHQAHQVVRESQQQLLSLIEQAPMGIALAEGRDMRITFGNERIFEIWGKGPDVIGRNILDALPELAGQPFVALMEGVYDSGVPYHGAETLARLERGGVLEEAYFDFVYTAIRNGDGRITGVMTLAIDVTERVLAGRALAKSEEKFRSLIADAPVATCLFREKGVNRIEEANEVMLKVWGKDASIIGKPLLEALPELSGQPFSTILDEIYDTGRPYTGKGVEAVLVVDGERRTFYYDFTYQPVFNAEGQVDGIIDMALDVTEQVLARNALALREAQLAAAIDVAGLGTFNIDLKTGLAHYGERVADWFGQPDGTALPELLRSVPAEDALKMQEAIGAACLPGADRQIDIEHSVRNPATGRQRIIHSKARIFTDNDGQPALLMGTGQDVTLQKDLQHALEGEVQIRTEELAASNEELASTIEELGESNEQLLRSNNELAQYAYVASHDLQEPLRKIRMFIDMLKGRQSLEPEALRLAAKIDQSAGRMAMLIRDVLAFSRLLNTKESIRPVNLNEVLANILVDFELRIQEAGAQVDVDRLPTIEGVGLQMNQLFYNLISNALKFVQAGKTPVIAIRCDVLSGAEQEALIRKPVPGVPYYRIRVSDNGIGFAPEFSEQIFEVFKRLHSKETYPGSGIGLALCRRIVANHKGLLLTESAPGSGATFTIILPERAQQPV